MLSNRATTSWESLPVRLDPFSLPVRYTAKLAGVQAVDEASIYLDHKMAIIKRRLAGLPLTVSMPVNAFRGVAVRSTPVNGGEEVSVSLELLHNDPALSLPLVVTDNYDDILADWRAWSRILGLPLLFVEADGSLAEPAPQIGRLQFDGATSRRRSATISRRPRFMRRRKTGHAGETTNCAGEREITARN